MMTMLQTLATAAEPKVWLDADLTGIVAIIAGAAVGVVALIMVNVRRTIIAEAREKSRRELAAYVAEGSITPDDAAKLLSAGPRDESEVAGKPGARG